VCPFMLINKKNIDLYMMLRCIRHFAIYEQRWPSRVPPHGTSPATPRAENAPVEQRHVVRIGPKMSSAAYKAKNLTRDEEEEEEAPPNKRQKTNVNQKVPSAGHRGSKLGRDQDQEKASAKFTYRAIALIRDGEEEQDEEEKRPSRKQKALPVRLDQSAVYKVKNLVHDEQEEEEGRPSKRPRAMMSEKESDEGRYEKPKKLVSRQIARTRLIPKPRRLSFATYRGRPGLLIVEEIPRKVAALDRNTSKTVKRRRGRPRLSSPRVISKTKVKIEDPQADIPVVAQPRATNGRFGKKDKSWRKSREYTAVGSTVADDDDDDDDADDDGDLEFKSPRRKRGIDAVEDSEEPPKKRSASEQNRSSGNDVEVVGPGQKVLPRPASGFRGGRLFSNPNPLRFALHAWAAPLILDESSDDEVKLPVTPEGGLSSAADIAPTEELMDSMFLPSILPRAPPLTCKPSPFVFAKNRWNATSAALNKIVDKNNGVSANSTLSEDNLRSNFRSSHASPEEEVILIFPLQKYQ
jgi:hypothetical protein